MYSSARRSVVPLWRRIHVTSLDRTSAVTNWRSSSDRWAVVTIAQRPVPSGVYSIDCRSSGWPMPHAANDGDASRPLSFIANFVRSAGREELLELEHAELADRRLLDLADQRRQVEGDALRPRRLDQVGEQDVLLARQRVGLDADERRAARTTNPSISSPTTSASAVAGTCSEPTMFTGHARLRARRVDREVGGRRAGRRSARSRSPSPARPVLPRRRLLRRRSRRA